jgi:hypothetical protein
MLVDESMNRHSVIVAVLLVGIVLIGQTLFADEDDRSKRLERLKYVAAEYEIHTIGEDGTRSKLSFQPEAVLRWSNPIRKTDDGAVFFWTDDGRPQVVACIYTYGEKGIDHEFQSLAERRLSADFEGQTVWTPETAGVKFVDIADAPTPANSPVLRLSQMRNLARRFRGSVAHAKGRLELRMLTQPVYRYPDDPSGRWLDGAVFAFVQGTDPEILILLEAQRVGSEYQWRYACARMTSAEAEAQIDDKPVWSVERWNWDPDPRNTYITFVKERL